MAEFNVSATLKNCHSNNSFKWTHNRRTKNSSGSCPEVVFILTSYYFGFGFKFSLLHGALVVELHLVVRARVFNLFVKLKLILNGIMVCIVCQGMLLKSITYFTTLHTTTTRVLKTEAKVHSNLICW